MVAVFYSLLTTATAVGCASPFEPLMKVLRPSDRRERQSKAHIFFFVVGEARRRGGGMIDAAAAPP